MNEANDSRRCVEVLFDDGGSEREENLGSCPALINSFILSRRHPVNRRVDRVCGFPHAMYIADLPCLHRE